MVIVEPRASMSFEARRKAMLNHINCKTKQVSIKTEVPFLNEDAPIFIKNFNDFEKESQSVNFIVK